jgi:hypothetical protein
MRPFPGAVVSLPWLHWLSGQGRGGTLAPEELIVRTRDSGTTMIPRSGRCRG